LRSPRKSAADTLAAANRVAIIADFAARPPHGWNHIVEIAETLGASVWDVGSRLNFPSDHPLNLTSDFDGCYDGVDVVLTLDIADFEKPTHVRDISTRTVVSKVQANATWIDIGFTDIEISKWSMDYARPYCHAGRELGTGTQIGLSLGVALANKGTGRLVVDLQPDGDLMFDAGSLWIAAKYKIPMLIVMFNNRAYYNDWNHQIVLAKTRGTDPARAHIGMDLYDPDPDFAGLAKSMGWYSEGPFENADDLKPALKRAIEQVKQGKPALIDAVCDRRNHG